MKSIILGTFVLVFFGCATAKQSTSTSHKTVEKNLDPRYGYSEVNPIKVGGVSKREGPQREIDYLRSLVGLNGENLSFYRIGSCCAFKTENSPFGDNGLLDIYSVTYKGKGDTVKLYLNMYDEDVLYAPEGFKFRM